MSGFVWIHLTWRNIVSTQEYVWAIFRPEVIIQWWADADGVHHWRIFRSNYRKLVWVGFEPTTNEFRLDTKANWVNRPPLTIIYKYIDR